MSSLMRRWQNEAGDAYLVSLVRAALGAMLLLNALREFHQLMEGAYFGDVFHLPMIPGALVPGPGVYTLLVAALLVFAVLVTLGWAARPALFGSAVVGLFLLL